MSVDESDRLARVALSRVLEPGAPDGLGLVAHLGAERLWRRLSEEEAVIEVREDERRVGEDARLRVSDLDPEQELARAVQQGIRFVVPGDEEWPQRLGELHGLPHVQGRGEVPVGLWVRGPMRLDELDHSVSVVGSRFATTYGADAACEIGGQISKAGVITVSGAAIGIDFAAHDGALKAHGRSVAVLAGGVDRPYPAVHRDLISHLAKEHAVISEAPPGASPLRMRFLGRNRLIAAVSTGTVVVEAAIRSGALNTANWAERLNRVVMGVPGPVTSGPSQGVHELIRSGAAVLVTSGADVLELVGAPGERLVEMPREQPRPRDLLSARQRQILDAVPVSEPAHVDSIARAAGIGLRETHASLGRLADREFVEVSGSGWRLGPRGRPSPGADGRSRADDRPG